MGGGNAGYVGQIRGSSGGPERSNEATVGPWWDYGVAVGQIWGSSGGLEEVCESSVRQWGPLWGSNGAEEGLWGLWHISGAGYGAVVGLWGGSEGSCGAGRALRGSVGQQWG